MPAMELPATLYIKAGAPAGVYDISTITHYMILVGNTTITHCMILVGNTTIHTVWYMY